MIALLKLVAIAFLVATNGFFVASEFALVSVRRARLEARAAAGSKNAKAALRLLDNPTIFISAGAFLGRLIGLKSTLDHAAVYTETELRQLIDVARDSGYLRAEERRLIHRVFEFSDTLVREAMVPRTEMAAIQNDSSLDQISKAFQQYGYSRLAVYEDSLDNVMGFLHSKDVMPFLLCPEKFRLQDALH